jgi:multidrug resistance efflux pump
MIVFLVLCYAALLFVLVKLKIIKLTIGWKLSPLFFMLVCFVLLVVPMQWGAPSGPVNVFRYVIEVVPNVSGEVVDVQVDPDKSLKKGDVLYQIDKRPFQTEVDRLTAAVAEAEQNVLQLEAAFNTATANLDQVIADRDLANLNYRRSETIRKDNPAAISERSLDVARQSLVAAEAVVRAAESTKTEARLAFEAEIDGQNTTVAQLNAQLKLAQLELEWTTVRAPANGYVMQLALRPGQRVSQTPGQSSIAFVEQDRTRLAVGIKQFQLRHVKPGQPAEIAFKLYPGQTFSARVESVIPMNSSGQVKVTGVLSDLEDKLTSKRLYGVILTLDDDAIDITELPGGAIGTADIYTERAKMTHVIRHIELRIKGWLNYVIP